MPRPFVLACITKYMILTYYTSRGKDMLDFILNVIIWTLALYGLVEIIKNILYIYTTTNLSANGIYLILAVKNQQDKIEGFLRTVLFRIIYRKRRFSKKGNYYRFRLYG